MTIADLTPRETQIVDLVYRGVKNERIAKSLGLECGTVKEYMHRIFQKTGVTNRTELAVWVFRQREGLTT